MQFEFLFNRERKAQPEGEWLRVGTRDIRLLFARHPRARRYVLRLCPDGAARVTIPRGGSFAEGRRFTNRNLGWLQKQLLRQASRPAEPKIWTAGTEILFRGETVRLEVTQAHQAAIIRFADEVLQLPLHEPRTAAVSETSRSKHPIPERELSWLHPDHTSTACSRNVEALDRQCNADIPDRSVHNANACAIQNQSRPESAPIAPSPVSPNLRPIVEKHLWQLASRELPTRVAQLAAEHAFQVRRVTVRNQRSRWGSCSRHGTISLNWRLLQTPFFVRDYIILHELAHLKEMNHSRRFWREVARLCPDFARAERWLKNHPGLFR